MNIPLVLAVEPAVPADGAGLARPSFPHCLLLAALLHLWLVALVGTAPGGVAAPDDGLWGAIQIRLTGIGPPDSPGQAPRPQPHSGPTGRAPEPRFGGTVPQAPPQPSPEPGAAELGSWNTRPSPAPVEPTAAPARPGTDPAPARSPVLTRTLPPAAERREEAVAPPAAAPALPEPLARPAPDASPAPSTAPRLAPADTVEAPVLERPAQALRDIASPAATPSVAARPQPAPAPQRDERVLAPAPVQPRAPVQPTRPVPLPDSPVPLAAPVPLTLPPTLAPSPPAPVAAPAPEPVRVADPPAEAAAPPALALEPRTAPRIAPVRPIDVGPSARGAAPDLALPPVRAAEPAATVPSPAAATAAAPPAATPARDSLLPAMPPVPAGGQPPASARAGAERAGAPGAAASAAPLNLDLQRARAPLPGLATPRALNLVPPPPERKSALTEGIEKAAKPDCRKAYSGMGPLAALPLAVDAVRDGGCRW